MASQGDKELGAIGGERQAGRIKSLSEDAVSQIKSSTVITTLNDVVLGLVKNALDADATNIDIAVNQARGGCVVEDNGLGIHPADFQEDGGLGKMYQTSKIDAEKSHGRFGTFLASLGAVSLLTVVSRHHRYRQCNSMTLHQNKVVSRLTPCPEHQRIGGSRHGTTVLVRDIFGNLPVRVKQRALASDTEIEKLWSELKLSLVAILLTWESEISLALVNEETGQSLLRLKSPTQETSVGSRLPWLLHQGHYLTPGSKHTWIPASASSTSIKIKGVIALEPVATKQLQFIFIGLNHLDKSVGSDLYDFINDRFKDSQFGALESFKDKPDPDQYDIRPRDLKPIKRGVERWPMFDLRISFPIHKEWTAKAMMGEQRALEKVMSALDALVKNWLATHYFAKLGTKRQFNQDLLIGSPRRKMTPKKDSSAQYSPNTPARPSPNTPLTAVLSSDASRSVNKRIKAFYNDTPSKPASEAPKSLLQPPSLHSDEDATFADFATPTKVRNRTEPRLPRQPAVASNLEASPWLNAIWENWKNPVYQTPEQHVKKSYKEVDKPGWHRCCRSPHIETQSIMANDISLPRGSKLSKTALRNARVIAQVDNQFILIQSLDDDDREVLVAVDQHAADERCKIEQLFAEFFQPAKESIRSARMSDFAPTVDCKDLPKPLMFELAIKELDQFRKKAKDFASWGILFNIPDPKDYLTDGMGQLTVRALPPTIAGRASGDPELLISMLRSELWKMIDHGIANDLHTSDTDSQHHWLRKLGKCPQGIIEMLNSRACRSAIMFNDALSVKECEQLIASLAECAFPFQCAHGRPSMVPLIHLGGAGVEPHKDEDMSFVEAFGAWKQRDRES
jgi:DNA mismatch repair protein MLH3